MVTMSGVPAAGTASSMARMLSRDAESSAYQPAPAAFSSYSNWAGHSWPKWVQPSAAFKDGTRKDVSHPQQSDPGAYEVHSTMASTAAFTHNKKTLLQNPPKQQPESASTAVSTSAPPQVNLELFPLNRKPLRWTL